MGVGHGGDALGDPRTRFLLELHSQGLSPRLGGESRDPADRDVGLGAREEGMP